MYFFAVPAQYRFRFVNEREQQMNRPRENEGTEREAPGSAVGICHVQETYF